jgi:hypothetical protein
VGGQDSRSGSGAMETLVAALTPSGDMPGSRSFVLGSKPGEYVRVDDLEGGEDVRRDLLNGWRAIDGDKNAALVEPAQQRCSYLVVKL